MEIRSKAFGNNGNIPLKYTCDGEDISPPIFWLGIPKDVKSLALIADDPDAPIGTWIHWVIYNIPPNENGLLENISPEKQLSNGALQGINDFKRIGYGGPCPPKGIHRYFFKLYALDTKLSIGSGITKEKLLSIMEGHILKEAELIGRYKR